MFFHIFDGEISNLNVIVLSKISEYEQVSEEILKILEKKKKKMKILKFQSKGSYKSLKNYKKHNFQSICFWLLDHEYYKNMNLEVDYLNKLEFFLELLNKKLKSLENLKLSCYKSIFDSFGSIFNGFNWNLPNKTEEFLNIIRINIKNIIAKPSADMILSEGNLYIRTPEFNQ